jgi:hypothetical protein
VVEHIEYILFRWLAPLGVDTYQVQNMIYNTITGVGVSNGKRGVSITVLKKNLAIFESFFKILFLVKASIEMQNVASLREDNKFFHRTLLYSITVIE